jgi:hypothetical protein
VEERQKRPIKKKKRGKFYNLKVGCVLWMTGGFAWSLEEEI